jgi:hypothetical protein
MDSRSVPRIALTDRPGFLGVAQQNLWVPTAYRMIDAVAVTLESFYKPELHAARNHGCEPFAKTLACGAIIPETG